MKSKSKKLNKTKLSKKKSNIKNKYKLDNTFHYNNDNDCKNSNRLNYLTDPNEFYNLLPKRLILKKNNNKSMLKELELDIYQDLTRKDVINTFNYMFYHIRIGIFVYIKNNKLHYFIPFVNQNYKNNFSSYLKFKNNMNDKQYIKNKQQYLKKGDTIEKDILKWSANNCLIGNWIENEVGDMGWYELYDMLYLTCMNRNVNDCMFFINRRDHPVLTPNGMEPYFHIFNNLNTPLSREKYNKYIPILSFSKNDNFADILIPNYDDWRSITKKYYPTQCKDNTTDTITTNWNKKISKAIFRGAATGCGTTPETNQRIKLALISKKLYKNPKTRNIMNAGIIKYNTRDKKFSNKEIDFFHYKDYKLYNVKFMPRNEQLNYKYIIHIDGHVSAYRLGSELSFGSTILKVDSLYNYKLWFSDYLKENIHYIRVKKDLSNIVQVIKWCKKNDNKCKEIANNSNKLYKKIMNKKFIFDFYSNIINSISHNFKI